MKIKKILFFLSLCFTFSFCDKNKTVIDWDGDYIYNEKPVKAIADYSMVMNWELKLDKKNKKSITFV